MRMVNYGQSHCVTILSKWEGLTINNKIFGNILGTTSASPHPINALLLRPSLGQEIVRIETRCNQNHSNPNQSYSNVARVFFRICFTMLVFFGWKRGGRWSLFLWLIDSPAFYTFTPLRSRTVWLTKTRSRIHQWWFFLHATHEIRGTLLFRHLSRNNIKLQMTDLVQRSDLVTTQQRITPTC